MIKLFLNFNLGVPRMKNSGQALYYKSDSAYAQRTAGFPCRSLTQKIEYANFETYFFDWSELQALSSKGIYWVMIRAKKGNFKRHSHEMI